MIEVLKPQPTEQTPYTVQDYPYGFTQRTKAQYWIDTTTKGQRIIFRTLNPKTQQWNKVKPSVYSDILVLYKNLDNGHIENIGLSFTYDGEEDLTKFLSECSEATLSEYQQNKLRIFRVILKTRQHLKLTIRENPTPEETKAIEEHSKESMDEIHNIFKYYLHEEQNKVN